MHADQTTTPAEEPDKCECTDLTDDGMCSWCQTEAEDDKYLPGACDEP